MKLKKLPDCIGVILLSIIVLPIAILVGLSEFAELVYDEIKRILKDE